MSPTLSFIVCCVPRTGSWLLSETLQSMGICGRPREYFDPATRHRYLNSWDMPQGTAFDEFFERVKTEATTPNGVFGVKVHWYQFEDLMQKLRSLPTLRKVPTRPLLNSLLPNLHYIYLTRRDKLRHAVSYARASETKLWWEVDPAMGPARCVLARTPRFDVARLDRLLYKILDHERRWRHFFSQQSIDPLTLHYEDLVKDHVGEARRVLSYLGLPAPHDLVIPKPRLRKQADSLSESWVRRYRQIRNERNVAVARPFASA
jgi:trehalose 2-sulfotransferase